MSASPVNPSTLGDKPHFQYKYGVSDPLTGDQKTHTEERDGDVVRGQVSYNVHWISRNKKINE